MGSVMCIRDRNALRVLFFYTQDSRELALAEAPASFSGFRSFRIVFPLQRWPHFRASARSESCSRCSAGLISRAMPLRLPLAVLLLPFLPLQFLLLLLFVLVLLLFLLLIFLLILL
mgnify:CR=1 FL=1